MIDKDISQYLALEQRARNLFGENYDLESCVEELRQYRNITLSPEQVRTLQKRFLDVSLRLGEYMAIGTPEECREAMEKQKRKLVKNPYRTSYIWKAGHCPVCGCGVTARWDYCQCCGQKLNWENHDVTK